MASVTAQSVQSVVIVDADRIVSTSRFNQYVYTDVDGIQYTYYNYTGYEAVAGDRIIIMQDVSNYLMQRTVFENTYGRPYIQQSSLIGATDGGEYVGVPVTQQGHLEVAIHDPLLPFGEISAEGMIPVFQCDAIYGANAGQNRLTTTGTGTATGTDGMFVASTGTTIYSYGTIQSRKRLRYRPGQGVVGRFTAMFSTPVASSIVVAGFGSAESGVYVGYNGTSFGLLHSTGGVREIQTLTISTASSTTESVTVTLNGTAFSVPVTNSANLNKTAFEVASYTYTGWSTEVEGATVRFLSNDVGNKAGAFSISGTTVVGAFAETRAGVAATETWIEQADWNGDPLDGTGQSGITLDPSKLNLFQFDIPYLGAGAVVIKCMTMGDGDNNATWTIIHSFQFPNQRTSPSFSNPSFPFTMAAYSAGSTTNVWVKSGSYAGFTCGEKRLSGNRFTVNGSQAAVTATPPAGATYYALDTIRNNYVYNGKANQSIVNVLSFTGCATGTDLVNIFAIKNGTLTGTPVFSSLSTISCSSKDTAATGVVATTNEQIIASLQSSGGNPVVFQFSDEVTLQPGETLTIAALKVSGASGVVVAGSVNVREDQ